MGINRRKALIGLGALAAGGSAFAGTGAFTSVQADRTMTVATANDADAFLALDTIEGSHNSAEFAEITDDGNGTLEIDIGDTDDGGSGVNLNAITHIDRVFKITIQGTQPVVIYMEELGNDGANTAAVDVGARTDQLDVDSPVGGDDQPSSDGIADEDIVDLAYPGPPDSGSSPGYENLGVYLGVGNSIELGIYIDTSDDNLNDGLNESSSSDLEADDLLLGDLTIYADATAADDDEYAYEAASSQSV